jgi:hypothetical protein
LKIDGGSASPAVLEKKILAAAYASSYSVGELVLRKIGGIELTGRALNKTAVRLGTEMVQQRDAQVKAYFSRPLLRRRTKPQTPIELACVSNDGGRMQTRDEGAGLGVHNPHWRETKNALFSRMKSRCFASDPHPELPPCFATREGVKGLLPGVLQSNTPSAAEEISEPVKQVFFPEDWRPERLFRTCLSTLVDSDTFGRMMEFEADSRGFYHAEKKAYVGDGLPYNWTIQQRYFRDFTPILDFVHAIERLYQAARCIDDDPDRRWEHYLRWARACWAGNVSDVSAELRTHQQALGLSPKDADKEDPRRLLAEAIGYLSNNATRMNYPEYRRQGLPITSSHMESLVKEINIRVKGTEKFFDDGAGGEAILQIRAAALCDDDRLKRFLANRPGHPFHPNVPRPSLATAT